MNQQQRKYMFDRVTSICNDKIKEIQKKYKEQVEETKDKHYKQKLDLFNSKDFKIKKNNTKIDIYSLEFNLVEPKEYDYRFVEDKKYEIAEQIRKEAYKVKDKIMLGDNEEFQKALDNLISTDFTYLLN